VSQPLAYLNGRFLPDAEAALPLHDAGLVLGAAVCDFCRTFQQRLYRWPDHLARLRRGCDACFIPLTPTDADLTAAAEHLVAHNAELAGPDAELALITFATPGPVGYYAGRDGVGPPTVALHTFPLPFERYRPFFSHGVALRVAGWQASCGLLGPGVKHRSRLGWWLADQRLRRQADLPLGTVALLLDDPEGSVTETAIGHVLFVKDGVVHTPPHRLVLEGISVRVVEGLCKKLGVAFEERPLPLRACREADEGMICGSGFCLAGVRSLDGHELPWPGPIFLRLLDAWSEAVGVAIDRQFLQGR
jgi:branched-subunit amino acid aminotransferase/4-amino-4-deoxychorismate lyase